MSTRKSAQGTVDALDLLTAALNAAGPVCEVWEGIIPSNNEAPDAVGSTLLATFVMSDVAFQPAQVAVNAATANANDIADEESILAGGLAQYFRMRVAAGVTPVVFQGPVGLDGSGEDLTFDDTTFVQGGLATISSFLLSLAN
jgi:hypothetical protein